MYFKVLVAPPPVNATIYAHYCHHYDEKFSKIRSSNFLY